MSQNIDVVVLNGDKEVVSSVILTEDEAFEQNHIQTIHSLYYQKLKEENYKLIIEY